MGTIFLQARWVCPIDRPSISGGVVTIEGERITAVEAAPAPGQRVVDLGDVILLPGFVNAHTHLEFSDLDTPLGEPGMALPAWIRRVIASRGRSHRDAPEAVRRGIAECLRRGVTTVGEIATTPLLTYRGSELSQLIAFHEVIAFSSARKESVLADVRRQFEEFEQPNSAQTAGGQIRRGLSPHAPYTVHPQAVGELVEYSLRWEVPLAMHLAESLEELELLERGTGPFQELLEERGMWDSGTIPLHTRPLDYLEQLAQAHRALIIHGNYLAEDEIAFLAERRERMSVVYCPRTQSFFGHPPFPVAKMLAAGVQVVVGTDSRASNPDLCLLSELRHIAAHYPEIPSTTILEMGTLSGAISLGLADQAGSITPGKLADLVALPCGLGASPFDEVLHTTGGPVCVFVRGKESQESIDESREPD